MIASAGSATQPRFIVGRPPMQTWSHTSVTTRISLGHFNQLVEYLRTLASLKRSIQAF